MIRLALLLLVALLVAACARDTRDSETRDAGATPQAGRVSDGAPVGTFDFSRIELPEPRPEPRSPYGNHSPYQVLGQTYRVMATADGYNELGIASWYGTKFHGRATSSGEPYDMYKMTAAHRTLPLPTYAEVRHRDNGRSIIVRINDRGPFHPDRIIDLSWAAAVMLGIDHSGTGPVEVTAITFDEPVRMATSPARLPVLLQVGAFGDRQRAEAMVARLNEAGMTPATAESARGASGRIWRVRVGPITQAERAMDLFESISALGFGQAQYVYP